MPKKDIIERLIHSGLNSEEINGSELNSDEVEELAIHQRILTNSRKLKVPEITDMGHFRKETFEKTIWKEKKIVKNTQGRSRTLFWGIGGVAAALIVLMLNNVFHFVVLQPPLVHVYVTKNAEQLELYLPDSSFVMLNASSNLSYDENSWKASRTVFLEGEAFFDVVPGKTFKVNNRSGFTTEVLGTSFNIQSRPEHYSVSCLSGKVQVIPPKGKNTVLTPGMTVNYSGNESGEIQEMDTVKMATWMEGYFYFEGQTLADVIKELERQFDVTIIVNDKDVFNRKYHGYFTKHSIENALELVFTPMNINYLYQENEKTIIIE